MALLATTNATSPPLPPCPRSPQLSADVGAPSILINNAGIATAHTILDSSEQSLEKIFRINLMSNWITIKEFLLAMLEARNGHIVSMASMASYFTCAGLVDYAAIKAGMLALHEGMRMGGSETSLFNISCL
jgi:all-trans-retinol dehydrogenase (NAD+)